jgi:hypothetical protein
MSSKEKRTVSVGVKMTPEDWSLLAKAAERIWPGAMLTRSSLLVSLAKRGADNAPPGKAGKKG